VVDDLSMKSSIGISGNDEDCNLSCICAYG
jgi:hypothetical protein